jgi:hypothetical protein
VGDGLLFAPQTQWEDAVVWDTRQDLVACFTWKKSRVRLFQTGIKTHEDTTTGGARGTILEVASSPN